MLKYLFLALLSFSFLNAAKPLDKLLKAQTKKENQVWFNKAVLELKTKNYVEALQLFQKTKKYSKYPSLLNIAIIEYETEKVDAAKVKFSNLANKEILNKNIYVYFSANLYMYKLTNSNEYLQNIVLNSENIDSTDQRSRALLSQAYIYLKDYEKAFLVLDHNIYKMAILALINEDYSKASELLNNIKDSELDETRLLDMVWFLIYAELKQGNIHNIPNLVKKLKFSEHSYYPSSRYPFLLSLKHTADNSYYLNSIDSFDMDIKIDLMFYFIPYIYSDNRQIEYVTTQSFLLENKDKVSSLEGMTQYDRLVLENINKDPYVFKDILKNFPYEDKKSYMSFNLGLSYAKVGEFKEALNEFKVAANLKPSNMLYKLLVLVSAKKTGEELKEEKLIKDHIGKSKGEYSSEVKALSSIIFQGTPANSLDLKKIKKGKFGNFIDYLSCHSQSEKKDCSYSRLFNSTNDELIKLLSLNANQELSEVSKISNIQDNFFKLEDGKYLLPVAYRLYIKYLKAVGLDVLRSNYNINGSSPVVSKYNLLLDLYSNKKSITFDKFISNMDSYNMNDRESLLLSAVIAIDKGINEDAYIDIALINALYKDNESLFLIGIRDLNSRQLDKALKRLENKFEHDFMDFKLNGLEALVEEI